MKKEIEAKKSVRAYEDAKAKGGRLGSSMNSSYLGTDQGNDSRFESNHELDELWTHIRNFFDDVNAKGEKRDIPKGDQPNKLKFMEACQSFDFEDKGVISEL